ncbi:MAG: EscU/YscU/HrcU family type III secretion system export apparatus switch protein, partial [Polyangiaceae bacterium]
MSDKTEAPTPRRIRKAREEGDSGSSAYAAQSVAFVVAIAVAPSVVRMLVTRSSADLRSAIASAATTGAAALRFDGYGVAWAVLVRVLPLLIAVGLAGGLAHALQTGGVVAASRVAPKLERLDPFAGAARLFSGERVFAVARSLAIGSVLALLAYRELRDHIADFGRVRMGFIGVVAADGATRFAWRVALVGLAIGIVDLVVTRRSWLRRLKMRKDEVKREHKESEGDPAVKAARERAYHELMSQATIASDRATANTRSPEK